MKILWKPEQVSRRLPRPVYYGAPREKPRVPTSKLALHADGRAISLEQATDAFTPRHTWGTLRKGWDSLGSQPSFFYCSAVPLLDCTAFFIGDKTMPKTTRFVKRGADSRE